MPTMPATQEHREKIGHHAPASMEEIMTLMAMVARPVGRKEITSNPDAQKALDVEWNKLMDKGAWRMDSVREWDEVRSEAQKKGKKAHVGKVLKSVLRRAANCPKVTSYGSSTVSYTHLTLPTNTVTCRSRWSPYH